jgi:hypothetical protein
MNTIRFPVTLSIYGFKALVDLGRYFSFLNYIQSVDHLGREMSPSQRPLPTHRTTQTQNKRTETSIHRVGF